MFRDLRNVIIDKILKRSSEGDCPTEKAPSSELLEDVILDIVAAMKNGNSSEIISDDLLISNITKRPFISFHYTNYKGERSIRKAVPLGMRFGSSGWHETSGYLLKAYDLEKEAIREFALADCNFTQTE